MSHTNIRNFILTIIEQHSGLSKLVVDDKAEEALTNFINSSQVLLLQIILKNDSVIFCTEVQSVKEKCVIFYKTSAQDLTTEDAQKHVNIITLIESPEKSLYQVLKQIYAPLLSAGNDLYSSKLQKNLLDLESNLRVLTYGRENDNINVILSVEDEVEYWKTIEQKKDSNNKDRESASTYRELFGDIIEEIKVMHSSPMPEVREATENIGGLLDDVWRQTVASYSQSRMTHMFDIIGHVICTLVQKSLSNTDLWTAHGISKDNEIQTLLSESLKVIQTWTSACKSLTETYWPNYALHTWSGKPYIPQFCLNFQIRLKEINDIRSTHSQLNKLLSPNERVEMKIDQLFEPFQNVNVWICNGPNQSWDSAVAKFSVGLKPAEVKIAEKLKPRLHNTSTKQMLYEFMRYKTLIARSLVKQALNSELEIFVSSLASLVRGARAQLQAGAPAERAPRPPEMSPLVRQLQWAKQIEAKVKDIHLCAEKYLSEFEGSSELLQLATQLLTELKAMYTQLHEEWSRDLQAQVKSGSLQLCLDKPVVEFSASSRMMVVNYNPRLVWVELEARALAALGLPSPPAATAIDTLTGALKHARALQQVASFHNTLGERMIPSTRPMMLQAALDLSSLVQDQKAVYWDDNERLVNYTEKLKNAVMKLESQNTYLTNQHLAIRGIVEQLMDTELLAKQSEWKKKIKDIRDIIEKVEANGHKNTEAWRLHWDWQLYKALECQYIKTLLSLHKHFPHVKVDLFLRGHTVRVQPPLEEIRVQHYHQLRRLVALPAQFVGLSTAYDKQSIFTSIVEKHSWLGNKAVKQLEAALCNLQLSCAAWTRRAALACVPDLEALCMEHLKTPQDWEVNFKACKAYGQAVAKMTFEDEKIDWISVGTATLRREFEAQARNLWACLMTSLQASCRRDTGDLDAFVANALLMLEDKALPKNAKELAEISAKQQALQAKMPEMEQLVEDLKKKGNMLRTWGGDVSVEGTLKEWQKIRELLIGHQQMFEHQADIVKSSLTGEWENLHTTVEAWSSRLAQSRTRLEDTHGVHYSDMVDRCRSVFDAYTQWEKFVGERDELMRECQKFNMKFEISEIWEDTEKLMTEYINTWTVFKDFSEEYETLAEQEWIVFQRKLHLLDEFTSKWSSKLEPITVVTLHMQQELDKYTDLTILLKYLRGSDFVEKHWREVFSLLDMEYKKPDTLHLRDWLNSALNIKKHIKALQKISSGATSEAAIRSALNELELWFAGARLTITYYSDKSKRPTPIVKDFKDILSKIEEQQWVVSSLSGSGGGGGGDAGAAWDSRLRAARALLRAAHHAQRRWLYLEPILSNDEGELGTKFRKVDLGFRQVTRVLEADPRLSALLHSARLQPMLDSISEQLLVCQSALNQYIDEKRAIFPRFYFLSDDDLLELLGQARAGADGREAVMQTHLKKLFPGTTGVRLGPGGLSITALCSHYGETFQLDHPVDIDCPVEMWLKNLETEMRLSLKHLTQKCVITNSLQEQDPFSLPTQILCLAQNIRFTEQAEKVIASKELHKLKTNVEKEKLYYASAEVEDESERHKRQALILQCAYYMSVIRILIDNNVTSINDWLWQKQLRFYLLNSKEVVAKMGLAQISYSYEYLGVHTGQFVRTELADECFLILTQALHLGLVGNPFGPAGTGKTESVKALGGLVGRLVLIFNCDEAMDAECMGRLLTGLALSGAWGCFDEFNRLTADTLAAVSHQLSSLLNAMQQRNEAASSTALLNGKKVTVSEWCGVAATMNPVGRGYGGRRSLPAALERVLRPIAMTEPRGDQLAKHLFAARCIDDAEALAEDLHTVFIMASTLLSDQRHYDWGLRALKATIGSCGSALSGRKEGKRVKNALRRALRLNSVSKLTRHDADRFENILSLVFANLTEEESTVDPISPALETSIITLGLIKNDFQMQKCKELYEQLQQRMGVVIVGPPGSGKTTIRRVLKNALAQQGRSIVEYVICPKAMGRERLLGHIDHDTRQWTDGVISATALEISNQPIDVWSWVVCDGDIDPEWIEALNSVLDDNRLLTLPSGWRIQFGSNVNFIFETDSLEHASPATVSRMGIILLSDEVSCAHEVLNNWLRKTEFENEMAKIALPLLEKITKKTIQWLNRHRSDMVIKFYDISIAKQMLTQFEYIVQNIGVSVIRSTPEELIYLTLERSVIGLLKDNAVHSFQEEISDILGPPPTSPGAPGDWVSDGLFLSARLAPCESVLRASVASTDAHLLIFGSDACAKNLIAEHVLKESNVPVIAIDCTPILEPSDIIAELKRNNAVRSGGRGSGAHSACVTLLARALHRARVDSWGSSPVQAFLLQLIQVGGFWELGSDEEGGTQWCGVARVKVVATSSSATAVAPRLAAAMQTLAIQEPDDDEILELTRHYLKQNIDKNTPEKEVTVLASAMLSLFKETTETFVSQPQYKWNASHLRRCCENVKWYSPSNTSELTAALVSEVNRAFKDRLETEEEKSQFVSISSNHLKGSGNGPLFFVTKQKADGVYTECVDQIEWYQITQKLINQCLTEQEYNIFGDSGAEVCSELATLCSSIAHSLNGGVCTLVSSAGAGRRASAQIVATALPAALFYVNHAAQFSAQFKNALSSYSEGTRTLLFISESAATASVLAAVEAHTLQCATADKEIKHNLGIVICLDKDQENLSDLLEKFPLLYNESHLVWLERWSHATLRQMPQLIVQRLNKENLPDTTKNQPDTIPVEGFVNIYNSLDTEWRRAPCRYVNFVKTYYLIVSRKKASLTQRQNMLSSGVEALKRARNEVATLQTEAAKQEAALSEKQAAATRALDQIGATVRATTDRKDEMHALKNSIEEENNKLQIRKKEIEKELASVEPVIAAARAAVGDIRPESLSEVRSLRAPPDVVRDVLEGVLRLMGIADTSWHSMKSFLSKRGVKEDIRCLDASQITPEAVQSVQKLLERRGASFEQATAKRASAACAPLAAWVKANLAYAGAIARIQPLQDQQRKLHKNLKDAEAQLAALSSGLATVDERVASLKDQLGQHTRDAAAIELSLNNAKATIEAARSLLDQLAHEYGAWEKDLENISKEISDLNVRSLLASAYIVYLPDVTEPQARDYLNKWSSLIGFDDPSFSIINFLSTIEKQLKWDAIGLPSDKSAIKNAILIDQILETNKCGFTPLIIDPDGEAISWLKSMLADVQCDFVSQHSEKLQTAVQYAVRLGRNLVITEVDSVHDAWSPLLAGLPLSNNAGSSPQASRLLLYCRDATLPQQIPPHFTARLSLIYFTQRLDSLTDQLVHYALQQQKPEVNEKSKEIKIKKATLQKQQHELQENLLQDLSTNGDILHDANLLASLKKTRATSAVISEALEAAKGIEDETRLSCEAYMKSAVPAAMLALAVKQLAVKKPLIALPVDTILDIFVDAVRRGDGKSVNNDDSVKYITRRIVERVMLGLHKKDKYIVVLNLLKQVYEDLVPENLWQLFIGSYDTMDDKSGMDQLRNNYSWIPETCLRKLIQLKFANEDFFTRLSLDDEKLWNDFMSSGELNTIRRLSLSAFETVLTVATMRPDSLYRAIVAFVDDVIGSGVMSSGEAIVVGARWGGRGVAGARAPRPVALLGAHAADRLAAHAPRRALTQVGVEEGVDAWEAGVNACRGGGWLALVVGAVPLGRELRAFITGFTQRPAEDFSEDFRLWIVLEDREIPSLISNACVNVIIEAPEGVKHNALSTMWSWGAQEGGPAAARLRAGLALFHARAQQRRAYIPQGWTRWYAWEWGEVAACARVISSCSAAMATALTGALYLSRVSHPPDRLAAAALLEATNRHPLLEGSSTQLQTYISAFDTLPDLDTPELLCLPANCRVAWEKNAVSDIISGLKELGSTVNIKKNEDKAPMKHLLNLWKKLMSGNPFIKGEFKFEKRARGWWAHVSACEAQQAARAARALHARLARCARSPHRHLHKVPDEWQLLWVGPDAPDAYIKEFCFRAKAAVSRLDSLSDDEDYMPTKVDLRSFLRPERVVWALRVRTAARLHCSVTSLALNVKWDCSEAPAGEAAGTGLVVTGARAAGAEWRAGRLAPPARSAPPHPPAPPLHLAYSLTQHSEAPTTEGWARVPVYSSGARDRVIFTARAPLAPGFTAQTALLHTVALFVASVD